LGVLLSRVLLGNIREVLGNFGHAGASGSLRQREVRKIYCRNPLTNVCACARLVINKELFMSSQNSDKEEKKPVCPNCGSLNVYYRIKKGYICRRCGHEWKKEESS